MKQGKRPLQYVPTPYPRNMSSCVWRSLIISLNRVDVKPRRPLKRADPSQNVSKVQSFSWRGGARDDATPDKDFSKFWNNSKGLKHPVAVHSSSTEISKVCHSFLRCHGNRKFHVGLAKPQVI